MKLYFVKTMIAVQILFATNLWAITPECQKALRDTAENSIKSNRTLMSLLDSINRYQGGSAETSASLVQLTVPLTGSFNLGSIESLKSLAAESNLILPADLSSFAQIGGTIALNIVLSGTSNEFSAFVSKFSEKFSDLKGATFADVLRTGERPFDANQLVPSAQVILPVVDSGMAWLVEFNLAISKSPISMMLDPMTGKMHLVVEKSFYSNLQKSRPDELQEPTNVVDVSGLSALKDGMKQAAGPLAIRTTQGNQYVIVGTDALMKFVAINQARQASASDLNLSREAFAELHQIIHGKPAVSAPIASRPSGPAAEIIIPTAPEKALNASRVLAEPKPVVSNAAPITPISPPAKNIKVRLGDTSITEMTSHLRRKEILEKFKKGISVQLAKHLRSPERFATIDPRVFAGHSPEAVRAKLVDMKAEIANKTGIDVEDVFLPELEEAILKFALHPLDPSLKPVRVAELNYQGGTHLSSYLDKDSIQHRPLLVVKENEVDDLVMLVVRIGQSSEGTKPKAFLPPAVVVPPPAAPLSPVESPALQPVVDSGSVAFAELPKRLSIEEAKALPVISASVFSDRAALSEVLRRLPQDGVAQLVDPDTGKSYVMFDPDTVHEEGGSVLGREFKDISLKAVEMLEIYDRAWGDTGYFSIAVDKILQQGGLQFVRDEMQGDSRSRKDVFIIADENGHVAILAANRILEEMKADAVQAKSAAAPTTQGPTIRNAMTLVAASTTQLPVSAPAQAPAIADRFKEMNQEELVLSFDDMLLAMNDASFNPEEYIPLLVHLRAQINPNSPVARMMNEVSDGKIDASESRAKELEKSNPAFGKKMSEIYNLIKAFRLQQAKDKAREETNRKYEEKLSAIVPKIQFAGYKPSDPAKAARAVAELISGYSMEEIDRIVGQLAFHPDFVKEASSLASSDVDALAGKLLDVSNGQTQGNTQFKFRGGAAIRFGGNSVLTLTKLGAAGRVTIIGTSPFANVKGAYLSNLQGRIDDLRR